uniref:Bulb-type lectin domain-containing protein n=1 Tax=Nelumbo nucifera TaxID=4432 RepID=A0A822XIZ3_NELNU|nr:TPA_asm: hypothetical protein HUJ06_021680 [Nelumbo nucifera]
MSVISKTSICAGGSCTDGGIPLFLVFSCFCVAAAVIDTLPQNQLLRDGEQLVSANGIFRLGFFSPGSSSNRYLGISYYQPQNLTVVWVANRRIPIEGVEEPVSMCWPFSSRRRLE